MAALATQAISEGGAITTAAATGGGDTIERGSGVAGWGIPVFLYATIGSTATTITLDGTAYGPYTTQTALMRVPSGMRGTRANITYSQVTNVAVGAVGVGVAGYATFGT